MSTPSPVVNVMRRAAVAAGKALRRDFGEVEKLQVSRKGPADFVSNADVKAERIVINELRKARPNFGVLSEEAGLIDGSDSAHRFLIDPLDGTTNFLHGLPLWAVSIGLEREGELIAGVVYDPIRDELFWGEKGRGAYLNQERIRASARRNVADSLFATGIPFKGSGTPEEHQNFLVEMGAVMSVSAGIRRWGVASLDLAYVAAGRFDGFWELGLNAWDYAAGSVLVREAGGYVAQMDGAPLRPDSPSIIATNGYLLHPLLKLLETSPTAKKSP